MESESSTVAIMSQNTYFDSAMQTTTSYKYIIRKEGSGEPILEQTRIAVRDIVEQWKMGASPEEIPFHFPHISLAQVFEALAYYQDNKDEIETFIERNAIPENLSGKTLPR